MICINSFTELQLNESKMMRVLYDSQKNGYKGTMVV